MSTVRKVTYSLPIELVAEIDRRTTLTAKPKSALVAAPLKLYPAEKDREELENVYRMAARDPLFQADNEAVLRDFADPAAAAPK